MLCYVYIISYTFPCFLTHDPGRLLALVSCVRVSCVKIVSASV